MDIKQHIMRGLATGAVLGLMLGIIILAMIDGADKEVARLDAVRQYNCEHYGEVINKHYGRDMCPEEKQ